MARTIKISMDVIKTAKRLVTMDRSELNDVRLLVALMDNDSEMSVDDYLRRCERNGDTRTRDLVMGIEAYLKSRETSEQSMQ